jgi:hypothetical protein
MRAGTALRPVKPNSEWAAKCQRIERGPFRLAREAHGKGEHL